LKEPATAETQPNKSNNGGCAKASPGRNALKFIHYLLNRQPLTSVVLAILIIFATMFVFFIAFVSVLHSQALAQASAQFMIGLLLSVVLIKSGAGLGAGLFVPLRDWGKNWWVPSSLMAVLVLTALLSEQINFTNLTFSFNHARDWLLATMATGCLEEIWFRGVCFYILYRAWGTTRSGLIKAAATQALLFGALHITNLHRADLAHVLYQSIYATFIGFGFAGLVAYSRSIWLAVLLHGCSNAAGKFANAFASPGYNFPESTPGIMLIVIGMFFLFGALPGAGCLSRAPLFNHQDMK
jgi:membrane protease YdiL (CAAX protease family)